MYIVRLKNSDRHFICSSGKLTLILCEEQFDLCLDDFEALVDFLLDGHLSSPSVELSNMIVSYEPDC